MVDAFYDGLAAVDVDSATIGPTLDAVTTHLFTGSVTEEGQALVVHQSDDGLEPIELGSSSTETLPGTGASESGCPVP